jgi:hypothetical protein
MKPKKLIVDFVELGLKYCFNFFSIPDPRFLIPRQKGDDFLWIDLIIISNRLIQLTMSIKRRKLWMDKKP